MNWDELLINETKYWHTNSEGIPSVIIVKYNEVKALLKKNDRRIALFEIKDVLELLLKIPIVLAITLLLKQDKNHSNEFYLVLAALLKTPLSLGDWRNLAIKLSQLDDLNDDLRFIINDISIRFSSDNKLKQCRDVVKWRNRTIGHGALMQEDTNDLYEDLKQMLLLIKAHLLNVQEKYKLFTIYMYTEEKGLCEFKCGEKSLHKDDQAYIKIESSLYSLSPFVEIFDGKLFLFDTYLHKKKMNVEYLDYAQAKRIKKNVKYLDELYSEAQKHINILGSTVAVNRLHSKKQEVQLLKNVENDYIVEPEYLFARLEKILDKFESGVFLLQMGRGMGKTTFVKLMDGTLKFKKRRTYPNLSIRCIYINSLQSLGVKGLCQKIERAFMHDDGGEELEGEGGETFRIYDKDSLVGGLRYYQELYMSSAGFIDVHSRVLLVIDGIDEININSNAEIIDLIPNANEVPKNVYILLSCRTDDEISSVLSERLNRINFSDKSIIAPTDKENVLLVNQFINSVVNNDILIDSERLTEIVNNRIIRANILRYIPEYIDDYYIVSSEEICSLYFKKMNFIYSEKYFSVVNKIIVLLTYVNIPLTLSQICSLLNLGEIDFRILYMIEDLSPIMEKNTDGNTITYIIKHEIYKEAVKNNFLYVLEEIIVNFYNDIYFEEPILNADNLIKIYLIVKYSKFASPEIYASAINEGYIIHLISFFENSYQYIDSLINDPNFKDFIVIEVYSCILYLIKDVVNDNTNLNYLKKELILLFYLFLRKNNYYQYISEELERTVKAYIDDRKTVSNANNSLIIDVIEARENQEEHSIVNPVSIQRDSESDSYNPLLSLFISHHNIFESPRECVLGLIEGVLGYLERTPYENIDLRLLIISNMLMKCISLNGYNANSFVVHIKKANVIGMETLIDLFSESFNFSEPLRNYLSYKQFYEKDQIMDSEKHYIVTILDEFINKISKQDKDEQFPISVSINGMHLYVKKEFLINLFEYISELENIYHLLKSGNLALEMKSISAYKAFYTHGGGYLFDCIMNDDRENFLYSFKASPENMIYVSQHDSAMIDIAKLRNLKETTRTDVLLLVNCSMIFRTYFLDNGKLETSKKIFSLLRILNRNPDIKELLRSVLQDVEEEYAILANQYSPIRVYKISHSLAVLKRKNLISETHGSFLQEFISIYDSFFQDHDVDYLKKKLMKLFFDKKLLSLLDQSLRKAFINQNINRFYKFSTYKDVIGEIENYDFTSYADLKRMMKGGMKHE